MTQNTKGKMSQVHRKNAHTRINSTLVKIHKYYTITQYVCVSASLQASRPFDEISSKVSLALRYRELYNWNVYKKEPQPGKAKYILQVYGFGSWRVDDKNKFCFCCTKASKPNSTDIHLAQLYNTCYVMLLQV